MEELILKGHSGCKLQLLKSESSDQIKCVRKFSSNIDYNNRLIAQATKQRNFDNEILNAPRVIQDGFLDDLYFFDMEYIRGNTLSHSIEKLTRTEIDSISKVIASFIKNNIKAGFDNDIDTHSNVMKKIDSIHSSIKDKDTNELLQNAFNLIRSSNFSEIKPGVCHGDLTFENIIITKQNIYLIDFLDTFLETPLADVSKLFQDLIVGWSFREKILKGSINENEQIKIHYFKNSLCENIKQTVNWEYVNIYLIIDLLRIIPYTKQREIYKFILEAILKLTKRLEKGDFYEYVNNTMRWPI